MSTPADPSPHPTMSTPAALPALSLGPSAASRWFYCRASVGFLAKNAHRLPKTESSYADEGSVAHEHAAAALVMGYSADAGFPSEEMAECVRLYAEFVLGQLTGAKSELFLVEEKVPLFYNPKRNGIVDAAVLTPERLHINDLKYGVGVSVEAERNLQLTIYANGIIRRLPRALPDSFPAELNIFQPRARDGRTVRSWSTTVGELRRLAEEIGAVAESILANPFEQPFHAEENGPCRFCDAKALCPAYAAHVLQELPSDVSSGEEPVTLYRQLALAPHVELTLEQVATIAANAPTVRSWLAAAESMVFDLLRSGSKVPGFKLVTGRAQRRWADPADAAKALAAVLGGDAETQLYERSLISPAQAEKLLKSRKLFKAHASRFNALTVRPDGAPTMALESDPRPAHDANADALADFSNLNDSKSE